MPASPDELTFDYEPDERPSLLLEQRAPLELATLVASPVFYGFGVQQGDGQPVITVPGFMGSDRYLVVMRNWLGRMGYTPFPSGINLCVGSPFELVATVIRSAEEAFAQLGRKVVLIGHSMGGILSRMAAWLRPDLVRHVITLGSPLSRHPRQAAHPMVKAMADMLIRDRTVSRTMEHGVAHTMTNQPLDDDIGITCVYTKEDPVVDWRSCVSNDPQMRSFEVQGTHTGLAWNPRVYKLVGRVLAQAA